MFPELTTAERESVARTLAFLNVEAVANANNQMYAVWDCLAGGLRERFYATPTPSTEPCNVIPLRRVRGA